jgi:hypothetical protein
MIRSTQFLRHILAPAFSLFLATSAVHHCWANTPESIKAVLENAQPLKYPRHDRLPLYVLPISQALQPIGDEESQKLLKELDARGIGYTVNWQPAQFEASLKEGLRIARLQQKIGQPVAVDATACLQKFCDGSPETLHIDKDGKRFADNSCGADLGCPLALEHRIPVIREQVEKFVAAYQAAGVHLDFVFADWEIDGPIEWNGSWAASKRCKTCCDGIPEIQDFRKYQIALREIRSKLQREAFANVVTRRFPQALVGNYAVYPNDGYRYWYDYFEKPADDSMPFRADQKARYREWHQEFPETHYTFAMPVIYTWYPTYDWYDFQPTDYRWFYNMLLNGSNAGRHTPASTPIIPFVHWHTTAPPPTPEPHVTQMSKEAYQELLWHLLLRGHDTFFLWCMANELAPEVKLVHEVYAEAGQYEDFLRRGKPISFLVPDRPTSVVSGLQLGNRVLVRRTEFGDATSRKPITLKLPDKPDEEIEIPAIAGNQIIEVRKTTPPATFLKRGGETLMPIGWYDMPSKDADLREMAAAGINLVHCGDRTSLDRAKVAGMLGWVSLSVQQGATPALRKQVEMVADHPALAVWEGPDEIVWTFTAYSSLAKSVGVTKEDWFAQRPNAVRYAESQATKILPNLRAGIALVRSIDKQNRPFWINEALNSDARYVREYANQVDAIGCDYYPVKSSEFDFGRFGRIVDRWQSIGRGKPVWMVLQAFSEHFMSPDRKSRYPHFAESRFMAYSAIAHGAKALLYWGSVNIDDPQFRQSLYSLTSELAAIQPFLISPSLPNVRAETIPDFDQPGGREVRAVGRRVGDDLLLILVNDEPQRQFGTMVHGLSDWQGKKLYELYGTDEPTIESDEQVFRLQPFEAKVYATSRRWESSRRTARDYVSPSNTQK